MIYQENYQKHNNFGKIKIHKCGRFLDILHSMSLWLDRTTQLLLWSKKTAFNLDLLAWRWLLPVHIAFPLIAMLNDLETKKKSWDWTPYSIVIIFHKYHNRHLLLATKVSIQDLSQLIHSIQALLCRDTRYIFWLSLQVVYWVLSFKYDGLSSSSSIGTAFSLKTYLQWFQKLNEDKICLK